MAFIDTWHAAVPASLAEFADLVTDPQDFTPALAAAAILWPLREPIHVHDGDAYDALYAVIGEPAGHLLKIIASWGEDRLAAVHALNRLAADNPAPQAALTHLVTSFNATQLLTERLVLRFSPQSPSTTYNINGAVQAALANFGGITTIGQLTLSSRSEAEELDTFLRESVAAYQRHLHDASRDAPTEAYKFLYPFDLRDQAIFFGRNTAVQALLYRIFRARLTVVHARSGAGKTSLLQAGVGPRLLDDGCLPVFARTYNDPVADIVKQIASHGPSLRPRLLANLSLREFLRYVVNHMGRRTRELVIVLDQFEELFTLTSPARRAQTLDVLVECIEDDSLPLRLVLAIRKDYFSDLAAFEPRLRSVFANQFQLEPMTEQEIRQAIIEPLRRIAPSVTYDEDLLQKLVGVLTTGELDLPQLQILCTRLHEKAKGAEHITLAIYKDAGEAKGILSQYFDDAMARFSALELPIARKTLVALVSSTDQRLIAAPAEIAQQTSEDVAQVEKILDKFVGARLLRRSDDGRYELSIDYVIPSVKRWIDPEQEEIKRIREALQRSVDDWRTDRLLIPPERLLLFHKRREVLTKLDDDARVCLLLSSAWYENRVEHWSDQADQPTIQRIIKLLVDDRPEVRRYAVRAWGRLGVLGRLDARQDLCAVLNQSGDPETKLEAAQALRRLGDSGVNTLLDVLNTATDWIMLSTVLETFHRDPDPRAVTLLIRALDLESDSARIILLARTLNVHKDVQAISPLVQALLRTPDQHIQQELISIIKALWDGAKTDEEENLRQLITIYSRNIAKLESQIAVYGERYAPPHLFSSLQENRTKLRQSCEILDHLLGPRRILDEPRTQVRIISVLGFEKAQKLIDILDIPRALDALIVVLTNPSDSDVWIDCSKVLFKLYEQASQARESLRALQRHRRYQEYVRAKTGLEATLGALNDLEQTEIRLRQQEGEFQSFNEALSVAEPSLAEGLIGALQQGVPTYVRHELVEVLARMGRGGLAPVAAILHSGDDLTRDDLVRALNGIVQQQALALDELRYLYRHLQHLHGLYSHRLAYLQEKQTIFGDELPDNFKSELAESPRSLAEIDSRIPLIEYELIALENQIVLPLVNLLQADVPELVQREVIKAVARLGLNDSVVVLEALRRLEPLATDTLISHWEQSAENRERNVRALRVMALRWALQASTTHPLNDYRALQSEQNSQEIARMLKQLWSMPEQLRYFERDVRTALHALVTATNDQACTSAAGLLEILWGRRIQPIRFLRLTSGITSELLSMLYHEFESPDKLEDYTLNDLLDRLEAQVAEVLITTLQRTNDADIQRSITATLARFGPAVADALANALEGTTESYQRQVLSDGAKRYVASLEKLRDIVRVRREHFDEFNEGYAYVLEQRERQIAIMGGHSYAPIEWLLDRDMITAATERLKSQGMELDKALTQIDQSILMLETATNLMMVSDTSRKVKSINDQGSQTIDNNREIPWDKGIAYNERAAHLQELLQNYRASLRQYLIQKSVLSIHTPPHVNFAIDKARSEIKRIKWNLRTWGLEVDDFPDEEPV